MRPAPRHPRFLPPLLAMVAGLLVIGCTTPPRNRLVAVGHPIQEANSLASLRRFRPIILTALTTFLGLLPMIFETSLQALFLVPMAISLGIGTLVSSLVILFLIPAIFALGDEAKQRAEEMLSDHPSPGIKPAES